MFEWLRNFFRRECKFVDVCPLFKKDSCCITGPIYDDMITLKSMCGKYRELDGWK
jgi:hypothetical protein